MPAMSDDPPAAAPIPSQRAVPSGRLSRFGQFGRLAGGVAGGMIAEGARRIADGERPTMRDMLMTPGNFARLADRLSHLRGAAMKLGQMISMDAGDMLPPELSQLMAGLRDKANHMPPRQLQQVLAREWGADWRTRFARFDPTPMAAASIGQVHHAVTRDGRDLAIKVQYPGVAQSIDADVDNVATLLRVSGLLPKELAIAPLLAAAKAQLAEEADYRREGAQMERYATLLAGEPDYVVPRLEAEFTTGSVLAMEFVAGVPVEALVDAPQDERDRVMTALLRLVLRELFEFGVMQTDPNFANYRYQSDSRRLVLLDFGAVRPIAAETSAAYRAVVAAALASDRAAVLAAAVAAGFLGAGAVERHGERIDGMIDVMLAKFDERGPFDFGNRAFVDQLRGPGTIVASDREAWHVPPADMLFVQRKISGTALLAARLGAQVDVRGLSSAALS